MNIRGLILTISFFLSDSREQVEIEHDIRRKYPKKWGAVPKDPRNTFYSNQNTNAELRKIPSKDVTPYEYTGHGESYFLSKEMYNSLLGTCRCGRKRTDGHVLKCLQKVKNVYLPSDDDDDDEGDEELSTVTKSAVGKSPRLFKKVPETSFGMVGWPHNRYSAMEFSTRYISPTYDMPGGRIDDHPYSNVFIG